MTACPRCFFDPYATPGRSWTFTLPLDVPSQNRSSSRARHSGLAHAYRRLRDNALWLIKNEAQKQAIPIARGRRRIVVTRLIGKGKRAFDRVNWAGGAKPIVDSLVKAGLLVDDTEKWLDDVYGQEKAVDGKDGVRVRIEELL